MSGRKKEQPEPGAVLEGRDLMATRFEVVIPGADRVLLTAAAEEALREVERLEAQLSFYQHSSELSGINAFAAQYPVRVEPQLFRLLTLARETSLRTGGAFDPTIGPLLRAWGFVGGTGQVANQDAVAEARERTGAHLLHLDDEEFTVWFEREGVALDLGAIGKGYAIDQAVEILRELAIEPALIHAGTSTVAALGAPPGEEGWRVALRDPSRGPDETLGEVLLRDRALSVSAPYGKAFREGNRLYGHVLDPRTGEPTQGALLAAVSHPSATLTDALSTALLVLGVEGLELIGREWAEADLLVIVEGHDGPRVETAGANPELFRLR
jgi:thiamine biosynthesis lipoprotein